MMEVKIQCGCGTRYKFDWEPASGFASVVQCPTCGGDGTSAANQIIRQGLPSSVAAPGMVGPSSRAGLRVTAASGQAAQLSAQTAKPSGPQFTGQAGRSLLERTSFFVKERVAMLKLTDTYDILDPA